MDETQAIIYGVFSGMDIIAGKQEFINSDRVKAFSNMILKELEHTIPSDEEVLRFNLFINKVNNLCTDIMLKWRLIYVKTAEMIWITIMRRGVWYMAVDARKKAKPTKNPLDEKFIRMVAELLNKWLE
jgi:hypothetical protein